MIQSCGLLTFLFLLSSVPAHPMMGEVDATISTLSAEMSTVPLLEAIANEQVTSTPRPSAEESESTMTDAPTTAAVPLDSSTILSTQTLSIVGMTNSFETTTPTYVMDNNIQEPATSTQLTPVPELTTMPQAVEINSVVPSDTTTHITPVSELSTMMQAVETNSMVPSDTSPVSELNTIMQVIETNSVVPSDTATHLTPVSEVSTMVQAVEPNSVSTPSETMTTTLPIALPATTITMTMATSNQDNNEILNPPSGTVSSAVPTTEISSFGGLDMSNHGEVDNVLTISSSEETTRMATSSGSNVDGGEKQPAPVAALAEPPKPQEPNELGGGNSGCHSISTSFAILSLAVLYVIV